MSLFLHADHPLVAKAQEITRPWYEPYPSVGQHDQAIAEILSTHMPNADPELIAAAVIIHSFRLCPADTNLQKILSTQLTPRINSIVTAFSNEASALSTLHGPGLSVYIRALIHTNPDAARISAADKNLTLTKLREARYDTGTEIEPTRVLAALKTYYRFFTYHAKPALPASLIAELTRLIAEIPG